MYAITFDLEISSLKEHYNKHYTNAYYEVRCILREYHFYNAQGNLYLTEKKDMANLYKAIEKLKKIDWFQKSVKNIRAFRVENWSDFTPLFKEN